MPTTLENLETIRDGWIAALAEDAANPQPSYSIDGQSVDRNAWRRSLLDSLKLLNEQILALDPFELRTIAI